MNEKLFIACFCGKYVCFIPSHRDSLYLLYWNSTWSAALLGLWDWLIAYYLNNTGEFIAGLKKMSYFVYIRGAAGSEIHEIVAQLIHEAEFFHGLWMYEILCEKMRAQNSGCVFCKPIQTNFSMTYGFHCLKNCAPAKRLLFHCHMTISDLSHQLSSFHSLCLWLS